ncbi:hypothetical protein Pcinc_043185 [Petrolisthes cinctipes]|uniref:Uncharacterized protein n=1 Tax=Petrolisthes cinctipes TaxID=88211 RepID=A0AAE1BI33_PETCI|nr:hypothetical protein Pcinc_043185 [Petrolisthes cinctipes]
MKRRSEERKRKEGRGEGGEEKEGRKRRSEERKRKEGRGEGGEEKEVRKRRRRRGKGRKEEEEERKRKEEKLTYRSPDRHTHPLEVTNVSVQKLRGKASPALCDRDLNYCLSNPPRLLSPQNEASSSGMASELGLSNVGGVFVVLLGGMGLALVVAMAEFLLECWDIAKDDQLPLMDVLSQELRFVFKCKGSSKPVRKKASESSDVGDPNSNTNIYGGSDVYNYTGKNPLT